MLALRRYLVVAALCFWQGGFTFYASVVVPVGQEVLGHLHQGFVTRRVTFFLNLSGAAACLVLGWDLLRCDDPSRGRRGMRVALWLVLVGTLVVLFQMHPRLDRLLDPEAFDVSDRRAFYPLHRLYLWVNTGQWAAALAWIALTLLAWRAEDQHRPAPEQPDDPAKKSAEEAAIPR